MNIKEVIGSDAIKHHLINIPHLPGIYQMISQKNEVLYVGKAKNLFKRVTNYTRSDIAYRTKLMVSLVSKVEVILTNSESEAFLLEASLIKKLQPKYNILLKDDKSFPYLKIRMDHDFPQIIKYRGKISSEYSFGPYASGNVLDSVIYDLQKIFKIRSCSDNYFKSRKRPCLQYEIQRCSAPCVNKISQTEYMEQISQIIKFLQGHNKNLQQELVDVMTRYSSEMEYEKAASVRDKIKALSYIQSKAFSADFTITNTDIIAFDPNSNVIFVMMLRVAGSAGGKAYFPENIEDLTTSEILENFLGIFYENLIAPKEIILSHLCTTYNICFNS